MDKKKPFYEIVAENLIEQLKKGTAPWQKPWNAGEPSGHMPVNPTTGNRYKGINAIHLMAQGHDDPRWMTYDQASKEGAQVRKGQKSTPIQFWKFTEEQDKLDADGKPVLDAEGKKVKVTVKLERPRVFPANVFNATQIDGLPALDRKPAPWDASERAENILAASGAKITHVNTDAAFYRPSTDSITLPEKAQFPTSDRYYATALHELGHWTGHETRLDRDLSNPFGSDEYAKEELRAEIASMLIGDELSIGHDPGQHVAYVASWIKSLEKDPLEIFRASSDAEKIFNYVMSMEQKLIQDRPQQQDQQAEIILELQELHKHAVPGYSPLDSWNNLNTTAQNIGLSAAIGRGGAEKHDPQYVITYANQAGDMTGITTELYTDGKAATSVSGQRVAGTGFTSDDEWQATALKDAAVQEKIAQIAAKNSEDKMLAISKQDASLADARKAGNKELATNISNAVLGFDLPNDWNGQTQVQGNVVATTNGRPTVALAQQLGVEPEFWSLYAVESTGNKEWLDDYQTEYEAKSVAERLALIDAHSQSSEEEKALRLALIQEERIKRDPASTAEDISAAKEARELTQATALVAETEQINAHEQRLKEHQEQQHQYINVPYREKDEAKALGAKWDRQQQSWYIPQGVDKSPFQKWALQQEPAQQAPAQLVVPYAERAQAKEGGAEWDKQVKSWFAGEKADMTKLARWLPDRRPAEQSPAMNPREEFAEALRSVGCIVAGEHPIMDGKKHRITVEGDKKTEQAGFYIGHLDGHPAGYIKNNRIGVETKWKAKGYALDETEKARLTAEAAQKLAHRAAEQSAAQESTAQRVQKQAITLTQIKQGQETPYLVAKGVPASSGILTDAEGQKTYIPAFDSSGKQWSMQYIQEDGIKRFAKESKKEGCFHPVGGMDALDNAPALVIAEGYATAATLAGALGHATVAAFDSGNLPTVAKVLREKYPDKPIVIAGDDDKNQILTSGTNPGRTKAEEAAKAVGGVVLLPTFAQGESTYPDNLARITPETYKGHEQAKAKLEAAAIENRTLPDDEKAVLEQNMLSRDQQSALAKMKQYTDFNDLATRSVLGLEAVKRQVLAAVSQATAKKSNAQQQENQIEREAPAINHEEQQTTIKKGVKR